MFGKLLNTQRGQGLVEYALIISLVSIVVIVLLILLGGRLNSTFSQISNSL
jgi:pilus assembly protein Flp/PilA